jgi:glutamate-ammonia-ligase adenylyltransferase
MGNEVAQHIADLPDKLQPAVERWFERFSQQGAVIPSGYAAAVVRLVACSEFAAKTLLRDPLWFVANVTSFSASPDDQELAEFVESIATSDADIAQVKTELRRYRHRQLLRVLWREVQGIADLDETLQQLSLIADRLLDAATRYAVTQLQTRFGDVRNARGQIIPLVILGMGKLGGRELNFSSDIDIIFCYPEDGQTDGPRSLSAHEYFTRLSRLVIALIDEITADGFVFRVDTRLRPFGDSGPPVASFAALESYFLGHGRDWERYAYVKARIVGSQPSPEVANELVGDLIRPFVYRRYLDYGVFESVREMQSLIAAEVSRRELADNVKLGPGGIREAEFIVQALQLVRGGSKPELQSRELQTVLPLLVSERSISQSDAEEIRGAYRYLRRLENFIQAIRDEQTHDLPSNDIDQARLCLALNYSDWQHLVGDLNRYRDFISTKFSTIAFRGQESVDSEAKDFRRLWKSQATVQEWTDSLRDLTGDDAEGFAEKIATFASSAAAKKIDAVSRARLERFAPKLIELAAMSARPLLALSRTVAVTERILRRSAYLALLNENQQALSRFVDLCARSQYIADQVAQYPILLDELLDPQTYSEGISKDGLLKELQQTLAGIKSADIEDRIQGIANFQRATMFRIAVADFNGNLPIMKVSDGLTWLAEVILDVPQYVLNGVTCEAGFGIVGYGKLGGLELSYGSDLDIVFLHDSKGDNQVSSGDKPLDNVIFFGRLVRRLVYFLTTQTSSGELYEVDTRLRPDGHSGLLVTSTVAFERYQEENAWTWEHQALLRARAVAGSEKISREFERIRQETLTGRVRREKLRDDVIAMRKRMRKELDRSDKSSFDLKHGSGGIGDIEFLVQYLVLREAGEHIDVIFYSDNIRQIDALIAAGILENDTGQRLQDIYRSYRLQVHRLVLDGEKAVVAAAGLSLDRDFVAAVWNDWLG